jgi:hypothetical protein
MPIVLADRPFRLIVSGWRGPRGPEQGRRPGATEALHGPRIRSKLHLVHDVYGDAVVLIHGECPYGGVDEIAEAAAVSWGWAVERYPPQIRDGKILGPARNAHMCSRGAGLLAAFPGPGSRGTWDCMRHAVRYGIDIQVYPLTAGHRVPEGRKP